ncbi:FadR/GntR family transcriptional regulator [Mesorhizobium sp. SB112]|uniref:FadR/GntR family transcriptional regulator n=1 Tax=Mesorhizobium sp. SB112 TaxID=3151853 RepID=UPI0032642A1A
MGKNRQSLSDQIAQELTRRIRDAVYVIGSRIPSEKELEAEFEVSRTVVREAVAVLRSDGILEARPGIGTFVASTGRGKALQFFAPAPERLSEALEIIELRIGVEVEAAGRAAERRTTEQLDAIERCLNAMALDPIANESPQLDFEFHRAIAQATNNSYFGRFLDFLGPHLIPRIMLQEKHGVHFDHEYIGGIHKEHKSIFDGIRDRNLVESRDAMRFHLMNSLYRYNYYYKR